MHRGKTATFIKENYLIVLIFLSGVFLRIYNLGTESIWYDEAISIAAAKLSIVDQLTWNIVQNESNPPLYYMFLHFWITIFGDSEFISRLPSAVLGSVSIFAMYAVGKLMFNKKAGLIAALILATSVFHIKYSQEARGYTLLVLLSLVSFYCLLKMTGSRKRIYGVFYVLGSVLMLYTHYYGALIIILQNIFCFTLFLKDRKAGELDVRRWLTLQAITGLFFLPGFLLWAKVTLSIQKGFWVPEPTLGQIAGYFTAYSGSSLVLMIFVIFALLSIVKFGNIQGSRGLKDFVMRLDNYPNGLGITSGSVMYLLLLWLIVPIAVPFIISIVSAPVLVFRYTICASLAFYILVSKGISNITNKWLILVVCALIIAVSMINVDKYYSRMDKDQWREVIRDIETDSGSGDIILVFPPYEAQSVDYYLERKDLRVITMSKKFPNLTNLGERNVWVVMHPDPRIWKRLKLRLYRTYDFISERNYVGLNVLQIRKKYLQ